MTIHTEPTKADPDYYPRMKINRRWYLIVPELQGREFNGHEGCAFYRPSNYIAYIDDYGHCDLMKKAVLAGHDGDSVPTFRRHDCGDTSTVFVAPSKFPEYLAAVAVLKMEGT